MEAEIFITLWYYLLMIILELDELATDDRSSWGLTSGFGNVQRGGAGEIDLAENKRN